MRRDGREVRTSLGIVDLIHFSDHLKIDNYPELLFNVEDMLLTARLTRPMKRQRIMDHVTVPSSRRGLGRVIPVGG
jgi:hypothetical protein